jgi:hypothetical protein
MVVSRSPYHLDSYLSVRRSRPFRVEVAKRIAALNAATGCRPMPPIAAADRARVRTQVAQESFWAEHGREPMDARELTGRSGKIRGHEPRRSPVMT